MTVTTPNIERLESPEFHNNLGNEIVNELRRHTFYRADWVHDRAPINICILQSPNSGLIHVVSRPEHPDDFYLTFISEPSITVDRSGVATLGWPTTSSFEIRTREGAVDVLFYDQGHVDAASLVQQATMLNLLKRSEHQAVKKSAP